MQVFVRAIDRHDIRGEDADSVHRVRRGVPQDLVMHPSTLARLRRHRCRAYTLRAAPVIKRVKRCSHKGAHLSRGCAIICSSKRHLFQGISAVVDFAAEPCICCGCTGNRCVTARRVEEEPATSGATIEQVQRTEPKTQKAACGYLEFQIDSLAVRCEQVIGHKGALTGNERHIGRTLIRPCCATCANRISRLSIPSVA